MGASATSASLPRRSCLSVPASSERKLAKATAVPADEVVIDLEDAVAASSKHSARSAAVEALERLDWTGTTVSVRVNAPGTPWCHLDIVALAALPELPVSIVVPKVQCAGDLAFVDRLLAGLEAAAPRRTPMRTQALIEDAPGLARVQEIAACSERLDALIIGYADLAASLGRSAAAALDPRSWDPAREAVLLAARANGLQAIDGPYLGVGPDDSFRESAMRARELGLDGKWAIHPSQVPPLAEIFSPTEQELTRARAVIAALESAERNAGEGAVALDGEMLDAAVALSARRVIARSGAAPTAGDGV